MAKAMTAEEVEQVREFFTSDVAEQLFTSMEHGLVSDWINGDTPDVREQAWRQMQAVLHLKFSLRDVAAMKKLTERSQERRVYHA